jgi:hypothetical protein
MKVTNSFQNDDNQWTVEVVAKPGYFYRSKSSSVEFSLGEKLFKLKMKKSGANILAKIKSLDNVAFGCKAQVTKLNDTVKISDEVFSLCDTKHTIIFKKVPINSLSQSKSELLLMVVFCDFQFVCKDKLVPTFKSELVKKSKVLERMFHSSNWIENQNHRMLIDDFETATVEDMVYFLNFKQLPKMTTRRKSELLLLADKYDISELVYLCETELAIHLDLKDCFEIFNLAAFIKAVHLHDACLQFILARWTFLTKTHTLALHANKELIIKSCINNILEGLPDIKQFFVAYAESDKSDESETFFDSVKWQIANYSRDTHNKRIIAALDFYSDRDALTKLIELLPWAQFHLKNLTSRNFFLY